MANLEVPSLLFSDLRPGTCFLKVALCTRAMKYAQASACVWCGGQGLRVCVNVCVDARQQLIGCSGAVPRCVVSFGVCGCKQEHTAYTTRCGCYMLCRRVYQFCCRRDCEVILLLPVVCV